MNKLTLLLLIFSFSFALHAQDETLKPMQNPEVLKTGITKLSKETSSIQADFEQVKHMEILSSALTSKGKIKFKAPDKLRWEYSEPFEYMIVLNQQKMFIKDEEKTNTFDLESSKTFKEINNIIVNSVQGNILDSERFDISYFESAANYMAKLNSTNSQMKEIINSIEIYFDKADFGVVSIKLIEPTGDYTSLNFHNRKLNKPIDDSSFILH
ncbi:outer membrane lipoprotein carrier protein LolA [Flammeovirgaceae bacterium SG7u.111]|nr:outer membrane lipoprotein carrier protein LolA [Flammeovirgaceae bacterium SG7u.132]WPO36156.1 outer membrane lipoprotein carrier protein LolA [Flammeovirgaceae bacterium SG7u.111]